jgi:hypothetical protein
VLPVLFFSFMGNIFSVYFSLKRFFVDMILWFPCAGLGFIAAKYKLFEVMDQTTLYLFKNNSDRAEVLVSFIVIIVTLYGMYSSPGIILKTRSSLFMPLVINMSFFYILFFTYAIKKIISFSNIKCISFLLETLGKNSLYMWLFNGVFFNVFKIYTQPILMYPHYSGLILIWGLVICFFLTKVFFVLRWLLNRWIERLNVC